MCSVSSRSQSEGGSMVVEILNRLFTKVIDRDASRTLSADQQHRTFFSILRPIWEAIDIGIRIRIRIHCIGEGNKSRLVIHRSWTGNPAKHIRNIRSMKSTCNVHTGKKKPRRPKVSFILSLMDICCADLRKVPICNLCQDNSIRASVTEHIVKTSSWEPF